MTPPLSPRPPSYRPLPPPPDGGADTLPAYRFPLSILPPPYVRGLQPPLPPTPNEPDTPPPSADKDLPLIPAPCRLRIFSNVAPAGGERPLPPSPEDLPSPRPTAFPPPPPPPPPHERPLPPLPIVAAPIQVLQGDVRRASGANDMRPLPPLPGSKRPLPLPPPPPPPGQDKDTHVDMTPLLPPLPGARERVPRLVGERRKRSRQREFETARASFGVRGGKTAVGGR